MTARQQDPKIAATSPATADWSFWGNLSSTFAFLPDFTEHGGATIKKRRKTAKKTPEQQTDGGSGGADGDDDDDSEVTFLHDFVAGGLAGSASVIVGHPFDTIKVRMQTSKNINVGLLGTLAEFGGPSSLFRGMAAPLGAAAVINAIVFSSYGVGSRLFDEYLVDPADWPDTDATHDPWQKAWCCGSFAGLIQCTVICPMEHVKCRLQVQQAGASGSYKGPVQAVKGIVQQHGVQRLYQGWWSTMWREVPAFGLYFATYDYLKDRANTFLANEDGKGQDLAFPEHTHTWLASAFAGGCAGCLTWAVVYPIDVIKTRVQTAALDTPLSRLSMWHVGKQIVHEHGWRHLFRGLPITLVRAFPVNGTIFPVYEFALLQMSERGY